MGWQDWVFEFRAPAAEAASYKFEVSVPEGIRITHLTLMAIGDTQPPTGATGASYTRINHRNGVISVSGCTEDAEYVSSGRLRVEPGGWIRTAAYCGLAIIALLIFARVFASRFELKDSDRHTDIVFLFSTFLFVVGTAVVTMLIRVGEHQLMTKMLEYLRFTATAFAIPSFGAVLALVFCGNSGQLKQFIIGFALFAGLLDALLFYALYRKSKT
jgi:hypothetical protein